MEFYRGRLIDHVHLVVRDLKASRRFYGAVLDAIGVPIIDAGEGYFFADEIFISEGERLTGRIHLAFQAPDRETVARFHAVGLAAGGTDNGAPGERDYHPGYYAAFLLDPDGNNIEAVTRGPVTRSVEAVVLRPAGE